MSSISDIVNNILRDINLTINDYQRVCHRLLANQVIYCDQSNTEREIYYLFVRMEELIVETLSLQGWRIYHDKQNAYIVLLAPGSRSPSIEHDDSEEVSGLRRRLNNEEICLLLLLNQSYQQALMNGGIDENGCANLAIEQLNQAFRTFLGRPAPTGALRNDCFRTMNSLRLIEASQEQWEQADGWIKVRPVITSFVFNDILNAIEKELPPDDSPFNSIESDADDEDTALLQVPTSAHLKETK